MTSSTYKNVREVSIFGGQLYTSADPTKASVTVATVGSGLPTSGSLAPAVSRHRPGRLTTVVANDSHSRFGGDNQSQSQ